MLDYLKKIKEIFAERVYCIGVKKNTDKAFHVTCLDWKWWFADPIAFFNSDKLYIFSETFDRLNGIGRIGLSEVNHNVVSRPKIIIAEPFHMSFPEVFTYKDDIYMIPETTENYSLRIYKMGSSIYEWTEFMDLRGYALADIVVYKDSGDLYLIASEIMKNNKHKTKLVIYRLNIEEKTIKSIYSCGNYMYASRNGGDLIIEDEKIIRVAQESTFTQYGNNICFYNVSGISNGNYQESLISKLYAQDVILEYPNRFWSGYAIHTYEKIKSYEIIDVTSLHYSLFMPLFKIIRFLSRKLVGYKHVKVGIKC